MKNILSCLLLLVSLVPLSSCSVDPKTDGFKFHLDPEGRECVALTRTIQFPPDYCPLEIYKLDPTTNQPVDPPEFIPAGSEYASCTEMVGDPPEEKSYVTLHDNCPGVVQGDPGFRRMAPCRSAMEFYKVPELVSTVSGGTTKGPVMWIYTEMQRIMLPASRTMYNALAQSDFLYNSMMGLATIAIAMWGYSLALQLRSPSMFDAFVIVMRILGVIAFGYNWENFQQLLFSSLEDPQDGTMGFISFMSNVATEATVNAASAVDSTADNATNLAEAGFENQNEMLMQLDNMLIMLFSWNFQKLFLALLFSGLNGVIYAFMLLVMMFFFIGAVVSVTQAIMIALLGRFFLYALAPFFITCLLLNYTKQLFFNWVELLISFCLQPILLGAFLGMFGALLIMFMGDIINAATIAGSPIQYICYRPYISLGGLIDMFYMWQFADSRGAVVPTGVLEDNLPLSFAHIIAIIILLDVVRGMASWLVHLSITMTKGAVSTMGSYIAGFDTLARLAGLTPTAAVGGVRGALMGNRTDQGWEGGLLRGGNPLSGGMAGMKRAAGAQLDDAAASLKRDFGGLGRNG